MNRTTKTSNQDRICRHLYTMKSVQEFLSPFVLPRPPEKMLEPRPSDNKVKEGLSSTLWERLLSQRGDVGTDITLHEHVYFGGCKSQSLRKEVWPYLLGVYSLHMSEEEKEKTRKDNAIRYEKALENCLTNVSQLADDAMDLDQERVIPFLDRCPAPNSPSSTNETLFSAIDECTDETQVTGKAVCDNESKTHLFSRSTLKDLDKKFIMRSECFDLGLNCRTCCADVIKVYDDFDACAAEITKRWTTFGIPSNGNDVISQSVRTLERSMRNIERSAKFICNIHDNVRKQYDAWIAHYTPDNNNNNNNNNNINNNHNAAQQRLSRHLSQIDKDVTRNDAGHPFFRIDGNREKLRNILMCFVWENPRHGYAQGMSDLCAPLLILLEDETETYACFAKMMNKMQTKFPRSDDGNAINIHLCADIEALLQLFDPELFNFLVNEERCAEIFVVVRSMCFQWLLIDFKREFGYDDVYRVWECMWTAQHVISPRLQVFVALALIELYRDVIMNATEDLSSFTDAFRRMRGKHNVGALLAHAHGLAETLQNAVYHVDEVSQERVSNGGLSMKK